MRLYPQRPDFASTTVAAAVPAVDVRNTVGPILYARAPAASNAASSWGEIDPSGPITSTTEP